MCSRDTHQLKRIFSVQQVVLEVLERDDEGAAGQLHLNMQVSRRGVVPENFTHNPIACVKSEQRYEKLGAVQVLSSSSSFGVPRLPVSN